VQHSKLALAGPRWVNSIGRLRFNEHLDHEDGPLVFQHACKLSPEGIVSKRRDSPYSSGRSRHWIKSKNPNAPAVNAKRGRLGAMEA
jgi:ATP-dependent DNA ligase